MWADYLCISKRAEDCTNHCSCQYTNASQCEIEVIPFEAGTLSPACYGFAAMPTISKWAPPTRDPHPRNARAGSSLSKYFT